MTAPASRSYPVPRAVLASTKPAVTSSPLFDAAVLAAGSGRVRRYQLPVLASGPWRSGAEWASAVLERESGAGDRSRSALLASIGYDPSSYVYHGLVDSSSGAELLTDVARTASADDPVQVWDGMGWGDLDLGDDDVVYAVLDEATLAELLEALGGGSSGLILRPTEPRGWLSAKPLDVLDEYDVPSSPALRHTGAMVSLDIDPGDAAQLAVPSGELPNDLHVTLAYLGDTEEQAIDYQAVQRAVAKWARRMGPLDGEVSGPAKFTATDKPVSVALVDVPALPEAREMLVRALEAEGVDVHKDHGYTPHITLAYADLLDFEVPNISMHWDSVSVHYADDVTQYELGTPALAAGGAGPDILYAIVDEFDTSAVLDLVQVRPGPVAYRRVGGKWVVDRDLLMRLVGVDPPPVVEVNPEQAQDVIAQVDSHDRQNPPGDGGPVAASGMWEEDLHPRKGGKFSKKNGSGSSPAGGPSGPGGRPAAGRPGSRGASARGPARPGGWTEGSGGMSRGVGMTPGQSRNAERRRQRATSGPAAGGTGAKGLYDLPDSIAASGVGQQFFDGQPAGFEKWLGEFLAKQSKPSKPSQSTSNSDPNDAASKAARRTATKQANANVKKQAASSAAGRPGWWDQVPKQYRAAMMAFLRAANGQAGGAVDRASQGVSDTQRRVAHADKKDRDFDLGFAKEGLGEARRRELADRQLQGLKDRLIQSGADPSAVARLMTAKVAEEKRAREDFARRRRMKVEQERVRRLAARNAEADTQNGPALTADASRMPSKLKRYWTKGEGAAKIRWGVGGDFDRCRKSLAKYVPPEMVSGACASLHHLALGVWPGRGKKH